MKRQTQDKSLEQLTIMQQHQHHQLHSPRRISVPVLVRDGKPCPSSGSAIRLSSFPGPSSPMPYCMSPSSYISVQQQAQQQQQQTSVSNGHLTPQAHPYAINSGSVVSEFDYHQNRHIPSYGQFATTLQQNFTDEQNNFIAPYDSSIANRDASMFSANQYMSRTW